MVPALQRLTARYAVVTAIAAGATQPIPLADEILVLPIHYWFAALFIKRRGNRLRGAPWWGVHAFVWGGVGARIVSRLALGFLPPAGAVANAGTSAAVTVLLARYLDRELGDPDR